MQSFLYILSGSYFCLLTGLSLAMPLASGLSSSKLLNLRRFQITFSNPLMLIQLSVIIYMQKLASPVVVVTLRSCMAFARCLHCC